MLKNIFQLVKSGFGSGVSSFLFLFFSFILDKYIDKKKSNFIALLISASANFYFQKMIFLLRGKIKYLIIFKYIIAEFIIIGTNHLSVSYLFDNEDIVKKIFPKKIFESSKFYNTFIRLFVQVIVFIFISFPLRKFWIFKL